MAKPTLVQSILNRPSQTYRFPQTKDYYSNKHELVRAAAEAASESRPQSYLTAPDRESGYYSSTSTTSVYSEARSSSVRWSREGAPLTPRSESLAPLTPSSASSNSNTDDRSEVPLTRPSTYTPPTSFAASDATPRQSPSSIYRTSDRKSNRSVSAGTQDGDTEGSVASGETTTDDDSDDIFYTPRSSLVGSPRNSRTSTGMLIDPRALTRALLPLPSSPLSRSKSSLGSEASLSDPTPQFQAADALPVSRTSSESSLLSTSSSSAEGTVASSMYASSRTATTITPLTSPPTSDYGSTRGKATVTTVTIARSHTRSQTAPSDTGTAASSKGQPRPLSATRRRSQSEIQRNSMDEDWAKDVRWLAPIIAAKSESPRRPNRVMPREYPHPEPPSVRSGPYGPRLPPQPSKSYPPPAPSAEHRKRSRRSRGSRSSRGRMSALLEEDESEYSDITPGESSAEPSRAPSPVQEEAPPRNDTSSPSPLGASASVSRAQSHRSGRSSSDEAAETPDARLKAYAQSPQSRKSYSHTRRLSRSISPTSFSYTNTLPTHAIPAPHLESSTPAANGYTALTLPRAAYHADAKGPSGDGKIDLVRAGIAQSSMATVEVTKGSALQSDTGAKKKRRTFSTLSLQLPFKILDKRNSKGKGKESQTPAHLLDTLPLPVAFTSHIPPPSYVPPSHVAVQVFAVGLDSLDSLLVQEKTVNGAKGAGFIPGRSIVGKVIEVGWDVKSDVCKKGDWVIALLDVKKSGALAEFITVERHRVHRAPQPLSRPTTFFPPNRRSNHVRSLSLPSQFNRHPYAQLHQDLISPMRMSIEELALLPLCALPAHRAIRTFADVISPAKPKANATEELRVRALVLQGHDGPGAIAVQLLARRGVKVWVQVPDSWARDDTNEGDDTDPGSRSGSSSKGKGKQTRFDRLEARLRAWGAEAICVGEPLEVLEKLAEDGRSFDAILDTVGGAEVFEAGRKVLLNDPEKDTTLQEGLDVSPTTATPSVDLPARASSSSNKRSFALTQYTTLVGDHPGRPIPSAQDHLRSGFRSLKRTISTGSRSRSSSPTKPSNGSVLTSASKDSLGSALRRNSSVKSKAKKRTVSYAWVSVAADVDFEGEDVRDSLGAVVSMVEEGAIRPWVGDDSEDGNLRVVPFDKAPEVFRRDGDGPVGALRDGGTCIVKVVP